MALICFVGTTQLSLGEKKIRLKFGEDGYDCCSIEIIVSAILAGLPSPSKRHYPHDPIFLDALLVNASSFLGGALAVQRVCDDDEFL